MKNFKKSILILFSASLLLSCSKKMQAFQFGITPIHTTISEVTEKEVNLLSSTIATNDETVNSTNLNENPAIAAAKEMIAAKAIKSEVRPSLKQKLAQKIIAKKIQKLEKKGFGGMNDKMKLGLVIALVSLLVLIITSVALLGALSNLFWLLGGLGLLTGLVIMLLALLEVI